MVTPDRRRRAVVVLQGRFVVDNGSGFPNAGPVGGSGSTAPPNEGQRDRCRPPM